MTIIDLGECENLFRNYYHLPDNELLYIKKIDIKQEGMNIPKVEYDIYSKLSGTKLEKLNISICDNSKISLLIPLIITENIDILDSKSKYYNDICYTTTSESGTDITLKDRKNEYIDGNKMVCQDDCDFSEYNENIQKVNCSCKVQKSSSLFENMKINKTKLLENFVDIKNIINIKFLVCYENLLTKDGIIHNIGCILILLIIIFHIVNIFIFFINQLNQINKRIDELIDGIKNLGKIKTRKKTTTIPTKTNKKNKIKTNKEEHNNKNNKIKLLKKPNRLKNVRKNIISKKASKSLAINNNNNINNSNSGRIRIKNNMSISNVIQKSVDRKNKKVNNMKDEEINALSYNLATIYDKRTYCEYYISLLKTKHNLIFSFCNSKDYNSRIIKIDLFFIGFTTYYTVNALFYNDDTMHNIYVNKGSFDLEHQIPIIIYSSLISIFLNALLKLLALSSNNIIKFKQDKTKNDVNIRGLNLKNKLRIKFIFYFIISLIFLLCFWYYISIFGVIYKNTQYHLLKDTLEYLHYLIIKENVYMVLVNYFKYFN